MPNVKSGEKKKKKKFVENSGERSVGQNGI